MDEQPPSVVGQHTLRHAIRATGAGLLGGDQALVTLKPGPVDGGIVFTRTDLEPPVRIPAVSAHVGAAGTAVTLTARDARIVGVEHLLSALHGLGIDNAEVELNGDELPIMDGSASPFVFLIQSAGIAAQGVARRFLRVRKPKHLRDGDADVALMPYAGCRVEYTLDCDAPALRGHGQRATFELSPGGYVREVSRARTFGFLADTGSPDTRAGGPIGEHPEPIVDGDTVLRHQAEFVKHKILDALGDLYLTGYPVLGCLVGRNSGHAANVALIELLLSDSEAFEIVTDGGVGLSVAGGRESARA